MATPGSTGPRRQAGAPRLDELRRLRRVRDRIDREFDRPLDVAGLAAGEHMSAGHLSRQFRAAYGESPYSYLMSRRIERAMALIRRGDQTITDICFQVGFSSLGTFSTRFSELVGMSPRAYRDAAVDGEHELPTFIVKNVLRPIRNREVR
ncbi:AraC family transcriptional regulator [Brevibacterium sanguinis]|uniref:AraC family transcriptional regulator n=2 Tax=Brevibacterium TaxID=1696 RepID=A0A366IJ57_9MICO|nr:MULTISPECIES: helix-turn-helix transcriptional regulator [Brevibacterium]RBP64720.1 AraC family transcriptional regulator [Brevibacterium sanguinis]RBP71637.1 AraC family transcriptional regulator [Brevibacterium celere]